MPLLTWNLSGNQLHSGGVAADHTSFAGWRRHRQLIWCGRICATISVALHFCSQSDLRATIPLSYAGSGQSSTSKPSIYQLQHRAVFVPEQWRKNVENRWFWAADFRGRRYPNFWLCIFKWHSLSSMRSVLVWVLFSSVSAQGSWREKQEGR